MSVKKRSRRSRNQRNQLIEPNLKLVNGCMLRILGTEGVVLERARGRYEDIFQAGCIGLMRAGDLFNKKRGLKFSTYADYWIRSAIARFIKGDNLICTPIKNSCEPDKAAAAKNISTLSGGLHEPEEAGDRLSYDDLEFLNHTLARLDEREKTIIMETVAHDRPDEEVGRTVGYSRFGVKYNREKILQKIRECG